MDIREAAVSFMPKGAIRLFSGPYVAGDSLVAAMSKTRQLSSQRIAATIDVLGEDATSDRDISEYVSIYERLVDAISGDPAFAKLPEPLRPSISLKPSSFVVAPKDDHGIVLDTDSVDWNSCGAAISQIVAHGASRGIRMTIDMENHQWTDFTLDTYASLFALHGRMVGTVLQSRLLRTKDDIRDLPDGSRVRLCIGIYDEPASVSLRDMKHMKAVMIPMAQSLLNKDVFLEFATHDIPLLHRFMKEIIIPGHVAADRFETQTLLGVPRQKLIHQFTSGEYFSQTPGGNGVDASLRQGVVHRMYVPFAEHWDQAIAYCRRRLQHSPNLFWTGVLNAPRVLHHSIFNK